MKKGDRNAVQVDPSNKAGSFAVADAVAVVRGVTAFPPAPPEKKIGGAKTDEATFSGAAAPPVKPIPKRQVMRRAKKPNRHTIRQQALQGTRTRRLLLFHEGLLTKSGVFYPTARNGSWRYGHNVRKSRLRQGDLVFFDTSGDGRLGHWDHVALYAGNGYVIHANNYYRYMKVHKQEMKYLRGYWGAKRLNSYR